MSLTLSTLSVDQLSTALAEKGLVPTPLLRWGIRGFLQQRLAGLREHDTAAWIEQMRAAPIALAPRESNEQHYEVPTAFYELVRPKARQPRS